MAGRTKGLWHCDSHAVHKAIRLDTTGISFIWNIDGKVTTLELQALALFARGIAKMRKGDIAGGSTDIYTARTLNVDVAVFARERFALTE